MDLPLTPAQARKLHSLLRSMLMYRAVREDPEAAWMRDVEKKLRSKADEVFCSDSNCDEIAYARGLCRKHHRAALRQEQKLRRSA